MAEEKAKVVTASKAQAAATEPVYPADEIALAAPKLYGGKYTQDIATAAFRSAGVKQATITEAEAVIKKFLGN